MHLPLKYYWNSARRYQDTASCLLHFWVLGKQIFKWDRHAKVIALPDLQLYFRFRGGKTCVIPSHISTTHTTYLSHFKTTIGVYYIDIDNRYYNKIAFAGEERKPRPDRQKFVDENELAILSILYKSTNNYYLYTGFQWRRCSKQN